MLPHREVLELLAEASRRSPTRAARRRAAAAEAIADAIGGRDPRRLRHVGMSDNPNRAGEPPCSWDAWSGGAEFLAAHPSANVRPAERARRKTPIAIAGLATPISGAVVPTGTSVHVDSMRAVRKGRGGADHPWHRDADPKKRIAR